MKKIRNFICSALVISTIGLGANDTSAASFGNSSSGAATVESYQIKYDGAAWNYSSSPYRSTSFKYRRGNQTLLSRTAYTGRVSGSVWDDLRWGEKYKTIFTWSRGARR